MPTRELSISYGTVTLGGSTARQITEWIKEDHGYETSAVEVEFVTTATTDAAFASELSTLRNAFRTPRQDLTVTQNSSTLLALKQSDNTGLDADPHIIKDGDPADTGRSRHFRVRIEFGVPADQITANNFRRYSTVAVNYSSSRQRTITISGTYTANSTDGTTSSFTQYRNQISTYGSSVTSVIDSTATWEVIGEPQVEYNDTNKVCAFSIMYREILHNQANGTLNDTGIVDPVMNIVVERIAPGDSFSGGFTFSGAAGGVQANIGNQQGIPPSNQTQTMESTSIQNPGNTTSLAPRPIRIFVTYSYGLDATVSKNLLSKWTGTIKPFIISEVVTKAGQGVVLLKEDPGFEDYPNRMTAILEFISYTANIFEQEITVADSTAFGRILAPLTTPDIYDFYDWPGPGFRQRTVSITYKQVVTGKSDANRILDSLVNEVAAGVSGMTNTAQWMPVSQRPAVKVIKQGLSGGKVEDIAMVTIERVAQRRNKKRASVANAGGVTGAGLTG